MKTYNIYNQMEQALRRKVWLKSGGYIIFDQVEALTIIDVNTGKYVGETNLMDTVYKTNMEAVVEICRQLRLRNTGGIILVDFIDMENYEYRSGILAALEEEFKKDRTRVTLLGMTQLGLVEMTRKKTGHALTYSFEKECPFCGGKGRVLFPKKPWRPGLIRKLSRWRKIPIVIPSLWRPILLLSLICSTQITAGVVSLEKKINKKIVLRGKAGAMMDDILIRPLYENEQKLASSPVNIGERLTLLVEKRHEEHENDAISNYGGLVIDIVDGAARIGNMAEIEIVTVSPTYARARILN